MARMKFVCDAERCIECNGCVTACKNEKMQWECGFANENFYAGFPHLYWAGTPLPGRFVRAAERYSKTKG